MKLWATMPMTLLLCAGLAGCRHKAPVIAPPPPPPTAPVPLEKAPGPPLIASVPTEPAPLPEKTVPVKKVKKPRKKAPPAPVPTPAPVEVASSGLPPANVIGTLTTGEASPARRQEAIDLLTALDKRIGGLPTDWKEKQKDGVVRVRYFESQAQVALKGGDAEGAVTLATKAKLLLDDLLK